MSAKLTSLIEDNMDTDIAYFNRLTDLTNVIPIIGKADELDHDAIPLLRASILENLQSGSVKPFLFGNSIKSVIETNSTNMQLLNQSTSTSEEPLAVGGANAESFSTQPSTQDKNLSPPFAISSLFGSDSLEMDASLLMSSSYSPPLLPSDLLSLVDLLFDPDNISRLRHCAGRKFLAWREQQQSAALLEVDDSFEMANSDPLRRARLQRLTGEVGRRASAPSDMLVRRSSLGRSLEAAGSDALPWFSIQKRWADNLHHNATAFDNIPHPDRARWLLEQIHEEVARGSIGVVGDRPSVDRPYTANSLVPIPSGASRSGAVSKRSSRSSRRPRNVAEAHLPAWAQRSGEKLRKAKNVDPRDPLGLCGAWDGWGKVLVWGVGGGVVVGAVWAVVRGWVVTWGWREA
jgi:hypothetical protein